MTAATRVIHQLLPSPWKFNIYLKWRHKSAGTWHWLVWYVFPDAFKDASKHQELLVQQHSVKFQKTWIFINTTVRTLFRDISEQKSNKYKNLIFLVQIFFSRVTTVQMFSMWMIKHFNGGENLKSTLLLAYPHEMKQ